MDIIHSTGGGALPELPEWAVTNKRSVTMELDRNSGVVEEEEERRYWLDLFILVKSHSRSRRGIWLTKRREESPRKVILDNLSKRKDLELFV
mgnify:CR=1 FL=1